MLRKKRLLCLALFILSVSAFADKNPIPILNHEKIKAHFKEYCYKCHDEDVQKGDIRLDTLPDHIQTQTQAQNWQDVLDVLNLGEMPPEKSKKHPPRHEMEDILETLSNSLRHVRLKLSDSGTETIVRRLNRREYTNTIEDLLGQKVNINNLPEDNLVEGFDTVGEALSFSSLHFNKYYEKGRSIILDAVTLGEKAEDYYARHEGEKKKTAHVQKILRGHKKKLEKAAKEKFGKSVDSLNDKQLKEIGADKTLYPAARDFLEIEASKTGFLSPQIGHPQSKIFYVELPKVNQEGEYLITIRAGNALPKKLGKKYKEDAKAILNFSLTRENHGEPEVDVFSYVLTNSYKQPREIQLKIRMIKNESYKLAFRGSSKHLNTPLVWIDWVDVKGPLKQVWPPKPYKSIFPNGISKDPADDEVREVIRNFAIKAFRGKKPENSYVDKLLEIYKTNMSHGKKFEEAISEPLAVILASPLFIYKVEKPQEKFISDKELASRISYFLWNTMPDNYLKGLAALDELHKKDVLIKQVDRLLKNPRSERFISSFVEQWLSLDKYDASEFSSKTSGYSTELKSSARKEPIELFKYLLKNNLSASNLIKSDFVIINETLANNYGIDGISGSDFQLVKLPKSSPYGGLVTQAATMMMTSHGTKTSPVERGAFVLRKILNAAPNPPPPNVPEIKEDDMKDKTPREVLKIHTDSPQCHSCHRKIDQIGLGLENFDYFARWRDKWDISKKSSVTIDASGNMHDGSGSFKNPFELKNHLSRYTPETVRGIIRSMIVYGLGRTVSFSDKEWIDRLIETSSKNQFKMKDLLVDFICSPEFRKK